MNVALLIPSPENRTNFRRDRQRFIPYLPGCYALSSFNGEVLYVGLTKNLRRRFGEHLDDRSKSVSTNFGVAFFFYWIVCDEVEKIERTWLNECEIADGILPSLNQIRSPCPG